LVRRLVRGSAVEIVSHRFQVTTVETFLFH
jgi:hypothetical protein